MQGQRTLHDLIQAKTVLQVVCARCRHEALIYPFDVGRKLGWNTPVDEVITHLRCSKCGFDIATVYEAGR